MNRFDPCRTAFASGWMTIRGARRRRNLDRGFVLSDHADWEGLNRAIEVVRFHETDNRARHLHVCPMCASELVQPVAWSEESDARWQLTLECPNCSWIEHGIFDRSQVEELEDKLDDGLSEMIADLQRLSQANMAEDIDRFVDALERDLVLPEDF